MNNPESIVVSLDLAKQLKEAGWSQHEMKVCTDGKERPCANTSFYWSETSKGNWMIVDSLKGTIAEDIAAPTAEEILRRLPQSIRSVGLNLSAKKGEREYVLHIVKTNTTRWRLIYWDSDGLPWVAPSADFIDESLANASAQMWLYLKKNNLLPSPL